VCHQGVYSEIKDQINPYHHHNDADNNYSHIDDIALQSQDPANWGGGRKFSEPHGAPLGRFYGEAATVLRLRLFFILCDEQL
jgi:hypothetical protein